MTYSVFVYGTLQFADIVAAVTGRSFEGIPATLEGYARYCVRRAPYPAIAPAESRVRGLIYADIDPDTLARIDDFEGEAYRRETVKVTDDEGRAWSAQTYVVRPRFHSLLVDAEWDEQEFARRWRDRYVRACRASAGPDR